MTNTTAIADGDFDGPCPGCGALPQPFAPTDDALPFGLTLIHRAGCRYATRTARRVEPDAVITGAQNAAAANRRRARLIDWLRRRGRAPGGGR